MLGLTAAENQVAVLLAQGKTIREIAAETERSPTAIKWHMRQVFAKHGISRQLELVKLVTALGEVPGRRR